MQMTFDDITIRKHRGNPESLAAGVIRRATAASQPSRVRLEVMASGFRGRTVDELADKWGAEVNRISGRFTELCRDGLIERRDHKGKRITRPTRSGCRAAVWFTVE